MLCADIVAWQGIASGNNSLCLLVCTFLSGIGIVPITQGSRSHGFISTVLSSFGLVLVSLYSFFCSCLCSFMLVLFYFQVQN